MLHMQFDGRGRFGLVVVSLALALALQASPSYAQDLTGTWSVKARACDALANTAGPYFGYGCSLAPPNTIYVQALDAQLVLVGIFPNQPALYKCALVATGVGGSFLGCSRCGSDDLYGALETDDFWTRSETLGGKVSDTKMKLNLQHVEAWDGHANPGVQPGTRWITGKWAAKKTDSVVPNLTDCSVP